MRGKVAKMIRSGVYGDTSLRIPRTMVCLKTNKTTAMNHPESKRSIYQKRKRSYKNNK